MRDVTAAGVMLLVARLARDALSNPEIGTHPRQSRHSRLKQTIDSAYIDF
jgi:hypothetical protein